MWALKRSWGWWKRRDARAEALRLSDLTGRGGLRDLVETGLRALAEVKEADLPGNVAPLPFGDWLRDKRTPTRHHRRHSYAQ